MRNGAAAIVPLVLAVMILFWFIMFLGGANDTLFQVSSLERVKHIQQKMLIPAAKKAYELEQLGTLTLDEVNTTVGIYIDVMMQKNLNTN